MGKVRFVSIRRRRDGFFETLEWSLQTEKEGVVQLLGVESGTDPLGQKDGLRERLVGGQDGGIEL